MPISYPYAGAAQPAAMAAALAAAAAAMQPMMPMAPGPHPGAPGVYHPMAQAVAAAQFAGSPALAAAGGPGGLPEGVQLYRLATAPPNVARLPAAQAATSRGSATASLDSSCSRRSLRAEATSVENAADAVTEADAVEGGGAAVEA